jgi:hypothetical protein
MNLTIRNCRRTKLGVGRGGNRARGTDHLGSGAAGRRGARAAASGGGLHASRGEGTTRGGGSDGSGSVDVRIAGRSGKSRPSRRGSDSESFHLRCCGEETANRIGVDVTLAVMRYGND